MQFPYKMRLQMKDVRMSVSASWDELLAAPLPPT